jgi:hypothetical protein
MNSMIRTIYRDNRLLFGPLRDSDLAVVSKDPLFANCGISAHADPQQGVEVFVTLPAQSKLAEKVNTWFLRNHQVLS